MAAATIVASPRPYVPMTEAGCNIASENAQTLPIRFHGKPVKAQLRTHSRSVHAAAKVNTRPTPGCRASFVRAQAAAGKGARIAASPIGASGRQPAELLGPGEQRVGDPVEAGGEVPEAEQETDDERGPPVSSPIEQPDEPGEGGNERRHRVDRRQGEHRHSAERQGEESSPPTTRAGHSQCQPAKPRSTTIATTRNTAKSGYRAGAHDQRGCARRAAASGESRGGKASSRRTRTRLIRLGSASSTSNSSPEG